MPIANYTTKIEAERTIGEIQAKLRRVKVRSTFVTWDDDGLPNGMGFSVETTWGLRDYLLPANVDGVWKVLKRTVNARTERRQAARVAWRTVQDWIEAQIAFMEAGAATFEQVMLPYMQEGKDGRTVFDVMEERLVKALPAGKQP